VGNDGEEGANTSGVLALSSHCSNIVTFNIPLSYEVPDQLHFFHFSTAEQYVPFAGEGRNFPSERRGQGSGSRLAVGSRQKKKRRNEETRKQRK
jgi:hypothetical protein